MDIYSNWGLGFAENSGFGPSIDSEMSRLQMNPTSLEPAILELESCVELLRPEPRDLLINFI